MRYGRDVRAGWAGVASGGKEARCCLPWGARQASLVHARGWLGVSGEARDTGPLAIFGPCGAGSNTTSLEVVVPKRSPSRNGCGHGGNFF